ncbi:MAG: hypothetical protein AAGG75_04125 [Bacteroidota bacterium]
MKSPLPITNLLSYLGLVVVNFLAIQVPFFGRTPGDVSDLYPNSFTPPDFSFSIWSFIYLLLGVFAFTQAKNLTRPEQPLAPETKAISYFFAGSCCCNFGWLLSWQSLHIGLSFLLIFLLWLLLVLLYYRLAILERARWTFTLPFSIYLAWIAVAGLANLNVLLLDAGFGFWGLSPENWTASLVGLGTFGGLLVLYLNKDIYFILVLIWAFLGIYVKNQSLATDSNIIVTTAITGIIILVVAGAGVGVKSILLEKN